MRDLMAGLRRAHARLSRRLAGTGERGAIGVLVAVLVAGGVLLGMGALVIDVGQLYQNRAELQNGADAAALAVAKSCLKGSCTPSVAASYASANASGLTGGTAGVTLVCGSGSLGACPASTGRLTDCPAAPAAAGANYVDVYTSTKLSNGSTVLPPSFAGALLGNSGYKGSTVGACAQAEWGSPLNAPVAAVTISACEWDYAVGWNSVTKTATSFAPAPPAIPDKSFDQVLQLHGKNSASGCATEPSGADAPGNFGWIDDPTTGKNPKSPVGCTMTVALSSYPGDTGNNAPSDCVTLLYNSWLNKTALYVPVYTTVSNNGNNAFYTITGFAEFVVTGYTLPGATQRSDWLNPAATCPSNSCIDGYFIQDLVDASGDLGGTYLGAGSTIKLSG